MGGRTIAFLEARRATGLAQLIPSYGGAPLAALADQELAGRAVGVQHYGEPNEELVEALRARGADVLEVEVYRWTLPDDLAPIQHLLAELLSARVDALIVTSQVQVRHLWQVAAAVGLAAALPDLLRDR